MTNITKIIIVLTNLGHCFEEEERQIVHCALSSMYIHMKNKLAIWSKVYQQFLLHDVGFITSFSSDTNYSLFFRNQHKLQ